MLGIGDFARLGQVSTRTLRHYAQRGVLPPASVDPATGYRYYELDQLADLHRIVALRELGLGLDGIRKLIADDVPVEQLRGMLRLAAPRSQRRSRLNNNGSAVWKLTSMQSTKERPWNLTRSS